MQTETIMTLATVLKTASIPTLDSWVRDVEQMCGADGVTATEARYLVGREKTRRTAAGNIQRNEGPAVDDESGPRFMGARFGEDY